MQQSSTTWPVYLCQKWSNATTTRMDNFCPMLQAYGSNLSIPADSHRQFRAIFMHLKG